MQLKFLGHSCFLVHFGGIKMIIDPYLIGNPQAVISPDQVTCDWILVTHGHSDHMGDAAEIGKQNNATIIAIAEVARYCAAKGAKSHSMNIGGKRNFGHFSVKLTEAQHSSSIGSNPIEYLGQSCGFLLFVGGKTVYFSGDTGIFGDMELIGRLHPIDLAVLPIGDNFTMGPEDALEAVKLLKPKQVIPVHYNTWDVIKQNPEQFKSEVEANTGVQVNVLLPGDTFEL